MTAAMNMPTMQSETTMFIRLQRKFENKKMPIHVALRQRANI